MDQTRPKRRRSGRSSEIVLLASFAFGAAACISAAGKIPNLELTGNLNFVGAFGLYTISGTVKNTGEATAREVQVYVTIYPGALTAWTVTSPRDIPAGATASFAVAFSDQDQSIKNTINKDATRVEFRYEDWNPPGRSRK